MLNGKNADASKIITK